METRVIRMWEERAQWTRSVGEEVSLLKLAYQIGNNGTRGRNFGEPWRICRELYSVINSALIVNWESGHVRNKRPGYDEQSMGCGRVGAAMEIHLEAGYDLLQHWYALRNSSSQSTSVVDETEGIPTKLMDERSAIEGCAEPRIMRYVHVWTAAAPRAFNIAKCGI